MVKMSIVRANILIRFIRAQILLKKLKTQVERA